MPTEEATEEEIALMFERANLFLDTVWKMLPRVHARDVVETLAMALRLIHDKAPAEFQREMRDFLTANLAEMKEIDA